MTKNTILVSSLLSAIGLYLFVMFLGDFAEPVKYWANLSAHLAFYYFLITFAVGPANKIFNDTFTLKLFRHRRYFGLGFAVTHSFHLLALTYFFVVTNESPEMLSIVGGGLGYVVMYMMALTSNSQMIKKLGSKRWKMLHSSGMHYFALIFLVTFTLRFIEEGFGPIYGIYVLLLVSVYTARIYIFKHS